MFKNMSPSQATELIKHLMTADFTNLERRIFIMEARLAAYNYVQENDPKNTKAIEQAEAQLVKALDDAIKAGYDMAKELKSSHQLRKSTPKQM